MEPSVLPQTEPTIDLDLSQAKRRREANLAIGPLPNPNDI